MILTQGRHLQTKPLKLLFLSIKVFFTGLRLQGILRTQLPVQKVQS